MKTALIVDDEYAIAEVLGELLVEDGWRVVLAHDGRQGLEAAGREKPDLVLLDVMMPHLSGIEVLRRLRQADATRAIPVVMFSAGSSAAAEALRPELAPVIFLKKPFEFRELLDAIERVTAAVPAAGSGGAGGRES